MKIKVLYVQITCFIFINSIFASPKIEVVCSDVDKISIVDILIVSKCGNFEMKTPFADKTEKGIDKALREHCASVEKAIFKENISKKQCRLKSFIHSLKPLNVLKNIMLFFGLKNNFTLGINNSLKNKIKIEELFGKKREAIFSDFYKNICEKIIKKSRVLIKKKDIRKDFFIIEKNRKPKEPVSVQTNMDNVLRFKEDNSFVIYKRVDKNIPEMLKNNDIACAPVKSYFANAIKDKSVLDNLNLTDEDKKNIDSEKIKNEIAILENYISDTYKNDFLLSSWHGKTSLSRAIWQDKYIVSKFSDTTIVKAIFQKARQGKENKVVLYSDDPDDYATLSSLVTSLGGMNTSYLTSVSPNWYSLGKKVDKVSWDQLSIMKVSKLKDVNPIEPEKNYRLDADYLKSIRTMCSNLIKVFNLSDNDLSNIDSTERTIREASPQSLLSTIFQFLAPLDSAQLSSITGSYAGVSTLGFSLNEQTLEVMSEFNNLKKHYSDEELLGHPLITHALDARHLLAALWGIQHNLSDISKGSGSEAQKELKNFLSKLVTNNLSPEASALLTVRLRQSLSILIEKSSSINKRLSDFETSLKSTTHNNVSILNSTP